MALFGNIFPCFKFDGYSIVLLKFVCHMALGQPEMGAFHCRTKGVPAVQLLCVGCREKSAGYRGLMPTIGVDLSLSLFYMSKCCSIQFLNMLCFPWTLTPRFNEQKCSDFYS